NPHSNKTTTKTNPAISRLSASPTPGNDPRHPNVARGVRETYIFQDLRRVSPERPLSDPAKLIIPAIFEVSGLLSLAAAGAPSDIPALRSG
ncbi:MAG: hypothetical protein ACI9U6_001071, partial [Loktanella salsilacus]|uniref:hypothetical protein n=1 Tax=Loktanella salsilacus TaxID=195913 RepID=UPI003988C169